MTIPAQKLDPKAKLPNRAHDSDAGLDLFALAGSTIEPGQRVGIGTGIALAIPTGQVGLIWDKSGLAVKAGLTTLAGVIDAGYRGEIIVALYNTSSEAYTLQAGDKVAQLLVQPVHLPTVTEVETLDDTNRGSGGFGSTGK